ncbi:MAG: NIL domain-containing protein [Firmicutes bacterium]|nr:NIL domain-containing protein [Bacillota bacterium]
MVEKRLHLTFPLSLVKEPIIWRLGRDFKVITNIRRANVTHEGGWVVLGLEGEELEIQRAVDYLVGRGVLVRPVDGQVLE